MFLEDSERLIPTHHRINPSTPESMRSFREAGIKTIRFDCWVSWHESEPSPGVYYWPDTIDREIGIAREAGIKVGLSVYRTAPHWLDKGKVEVVRTQGTWWIPHDRAFGVNWCAIDPFCADALKRELEFLERACEHYSVPGEVQCEYGMPYSAERLLPHFSEYTEQMCIDVVLARQEVFAKYSDGLWTALHPALAMGITSIDAHTLPNVGNEHTPAIYKAMHKRFPGCDLNRILYGFFALGCGIDVWRSGLVLPHVRNWVGGEFSSGVVQHAPMLNPNRVWGMIMACPACFPDDIPCQPRPDEFENIAEAVEILENERSEAEEIFMQSG